MENCIFCNIKDKKIPKEFIYEDEDIMVFPDIHPVKPVHLLIIPKEHIEDFLYIDDMTIMDKIRTVIQKMIKEQKLEDKGYKIVVNGGGGQVVPHLHFHLLGPTGKAIAM
ncbi:MAG TPA: HIT domain-containing protein [Candidatus Saccharimonadales bacterium]|nr:HIT domain-containing protein [Candidatus Saccharimonadales bacterium]